MSINYVCSLGCLCHVATYLDRDGMRLASYPFDWLCSELSIVESCIKNRFKDFMDRDMYKRYDNGTKCEHKLYSSKGRPLFVHHDPQGVEEDYQRFLSRC